MAQQAALVELKKIKAEEKLERQLALVTVDQAPTEATWLQEMSQGLFADSREEHDALEAKPSEADLQSLNNVLKAKTKKKRTRQKMLLMEEKKKQMERQKKQRQSDIYRLKSIKADIRQKESEVSSRTKKAELERQQRRAKGTKRLNRTRYEEPDIPINLISELTGSLRSVKVEGNLLEDRFKSLQKRNIIEPRERFLRKRVYKKKVYEKKTQREITK